MGGGRCGSVWCTGSCSDVAAVHVDVGSDVAAVCVDVSSLQSSTYSCRNPPESGRFREFRGMEF